MFERWMVNRVAFEPPSDYVPSDGGSGSSGRKKLWMILGGGCLAIVIAIGLLFAAGAFKAVSCCNQFQSTMEHTVAVQSFGHEFATLLGDQKVDEAYDRFGNTLQAKMTRDDLAEQVEQHSSYFEAALSPRLMDTNARHGSEGITDVLAWRLRYQYASPKGQQMLLVDVEVERVDEQFEVVGLNFDVRSRSLSLEPPAQEVNAFHQELQRGNYEVAYGRLSPRFRTETDSDVFRAFLDDQGDLFTRSSLEVKEVEYEGRSRSTVVAFVESDSGKRAIVQYELETITPGVDQWKIASVSPMLQAVEDEESGDEELEALDSVEVEVDEDAAGENNSPGGEDSD